MIMANFHLVTGYAGQEHVTSADQGSFHMALFGSGQFVLGRGNQCAASIISNNQIRILDGDIYMQGRFIRLDEGTYSDLNIDNGAQGMKRNDLIVLRYKKDSVTGVESVEPVVIKGTAVANNPADPAYTSGDIINDHVLLNDMPLYRVPLDGLNVGNLVPMFTVFSTTLPSVVEDFHNSKATSVITLTAAGWSGNKQIVSAGGVTSNNLVFISPAPVSQDAYTNAGIRCTTQSPGLLTFEYSQAPSADITVNVVAFN